MMMIRNADSVRDKLIWAIEDENRGGETRGVVRSVVEEDLLPAITQYDPAHLVELGMRAVVRDVQEWIDRNTGDAESIDSKQLRAYLLAALITAGGSEDPLLD